MYPFMKYGNVKQLAIMEHIVMDLFGNIMLVFFIKIQNVIIRRQKKILTVLRSLHKVIFSVKISKILNKESFVLIFSIEIKQGGVGFYRGF